MPRPPTAPEGFAKRAVRRGAAWRANTHFMGQRSARFPTMIPSYQSRNDGP
jgi:hypothetical protein